MVEQWTHKPLDVGSNPTLATIYLTKFVVLKTARMAPHAFEFLASLFLPLLPHLPGSDRGEEQYLRVREGSGDAFHLLQVCVGDAADACIYHGAQLSDFFSGQFCVGIIFCCHAILLKKIEFTTPNIQVIGAQ